MKYADSEEFAVMFVPEESIKLDAGIQPVFENYLLALRPTFNARGILMTLGLSETEDSSEAQVSVSDILEKIDDQGFTLVRSSFGTNLPADIPLSDLLYARLDGNLEVYLLENVIEALQKRGACSAQIFVEEVVVSITSGTGMEVFRFVFPINEHIFSMFFRH
jgi:hypothetical protein